MRNPKAPPPDSVILVGGPDTGKTNFLVRLFVAMTEANGLVTAPEMPTQIAYLETGRRHLAQGRFVPHSGAETLGDLNAEVEIIGRGKALVQAPDSKGETWATIVVDREIDIPWLDRVRRASGAMLFVRPHSEETIDHLDWVTAAEWMSHDPQGQDNTVPLALPSQIVATELLTLLEDELGTALSGVTPRISIIVTAWDAVPPEFVGRDPLEFLEHEYPVFCGRVLDCERLATQVFGCSIVGGDLKDDPAFREAYREMEIETSGFITIAQSDGTARQVADMTLPLAWSLGVNTPKGTPGA